MNSPQLLLTTTNPDETRAVGYRLAPLLTAGDLLTLQGDLGAGKTTLIQGLVRGLGSPAPATSPTFTLVQEYRGGRLTVFHFDVYRLQNATELYNIGFDEYLTAGGIVVIEWPQKVETALPQERLEVLIDDINDTDSPDARRITLIGHGGRWANFGTDWNTIC